MKPAVTITEEDHFISGTTSPVLIENFVYSSGKAFRIGIREFLVVVEGNSSVFVVLMERLEGFRSIPEEHDSFVGAPLDDSAFVVFSPN